jgi:hypothetical protein
MSVHIENMALSYAAKGWVLVPLYGVVEPEVCTCWKGKDCGTPGKHPSGGNAWHLSASKDEERILSWFEGSKPVNLGILLGPKSGVIDVELDGPDAIAAWNSLGLGEIYTPTYKAGRGPHRLFRWSEDLPAVQVKKPLGIEVRIGNDGKAAQSVLPPSRHHTGVYYEWLQGLSPDDVELAPLPDKLVSLLWNDDGTGQARSIARSRSREILHRPVSTGSRNDDLHRFAVSEAFRSGPNLDDEREQQDLLLKIRAVNHISCKPPLDDSEIVNIYRSAIAYARRNRAAGVDERSAIEAAAGSAPTPRNTGAALPSQGWQRVFTEIGLSWAPLIPDSDSDPEWGPGEWQLTVVHSDPLEYRLHVPAWRQHTADGTGNVSLTVDQFRSAAKTAACVLASTGTVMLDDEPKKWKRIWDGGYTVRDNVSSDQPRKRVARGVKAKLLDNVTHEQPGASSLRYVLLATWLYDRLSQASQPSDDDVPDPTGRAAWRQDGTLWFAWGKVWEDIERQHRVNDGERIALKRRLLARLGGDKDFSHREHRHLGGARKSYVVWSRREFAVLEEIAATERAGETGGGVI